MRKWRITGLILMALGVITLLMGPEWPMLQTPAAMSYRAVALSAGAILLLCGAALALFSWGGPTQEEHPHIKKS